MSALASNAASWRLRSAGALLFAVMPAAILAPRAGGIVFWLLALCGVWTLLADRSLLPPNPGRSMPWIVATVPLGLNIASVLAFDSAMREVSWTPLLALPLIVAVAGTLDDPVRTFARGGIPAALIGLCTACWSRFVLREPEPMFLMNQQLFGNLALASTLLCAWCVADVGSDRRARAIALLGVASGLATWLMSGYRGGLLCLPLIACALLRAGEGRAARVHVPWRSVLAAAALATAALAVLQPSGSVISKLGKIDDQWASFQQGRVERSSVGSRIAMFSASWRMLQAHPWTGIGVHRFQTELEAQQAAGLYPKDANLFRHPHNTYLAIAVEYGALGSAVMILVGVLVVRMIRPAPRPTRLLAWWLLASWLVFGLTNDLFAHQTLLRTLIATVAVFAATGIATAQRQHGAQAYRAGGTPADAPVSGGQSPRR